MTAVAGYELVPVPLGLGKQLLVLVELSVDRVPVVVVVGQSGVDLRRRQVGIRLADLLVGGVVLVEEHHVVNTDARTFDTSPSATDPEIGRAHV